MTALKNEIIITGINGFVGEHLARHFKSLGYRVHGLGRGDAANTKATGSVDRYSSADLLNTPSVEKIDFSQAKAIIHLAGLASVGESFEKPDLYREGNATMTNNLLTVSAAQGFKGRTVVVSTGALYDPNQPMPLHENSKTVGNSPYAEGKIKTEAVVQQHIRGGIDAVIARPFNHIGPGQGNGFLVPDLYSALIEAKQSQNNSIAIGSLTTRRDYTDVRDIVKAYGLLTLAETLHDTVYNVCSGTSSSGAEILDLLQEATNTTEITTTTDPSRIRPTDPKELVGDASRIKNELGWQPEIPVSQTIHDFVQQKKAQ